MIQAQREKNNNPADQVKSSRIHFKTKQKAYWVLRKVEVET